MSSSWNNLESMTALNNTLMWLGGIMTVIVAFVGVAYLVTSRQVETLKLKQSVRSFNAEQRTAFLLVLNKGKKGAVAIQYDKIGGREAREFANELADVLWTNGWWVFPDLETASGEAVRRPGIPEGRPEVSASIELDIPDGLTIEFYPNCVADEGQTLADALGAAGYIPNWRPMKKTPSKKILSPLRLLVGPKSN